MMLPTQIHRTNQPIDKDLSEHDLHILKLIEECNTFPQLARFFPDTPKHRISYWVRNLANKGFVTLVNVWS